MRGQVIGINTAIASRSGGYMGVGFAVPVNLAGQVMKQIREKGEVIRGWLGVSIQQLTPDLAESMHLKAGEGVLVTQVFEGGPADKAGIKAGDVVVEFNGKAVKTPGELQNAVAWIPPEAKVPVVVLRDGKRETLTATIEKRGEQAEEAKAQPGTPSEIKDLGIQVSGVTPEAQARFGYKPGQGVLITGVEPGSLAGMAGLREGMLILQIARQKVTSVREFKEAMKKADLAKGVPMLVRAADRQMFVLLKKQG
jgi:serine protease Do